MSSVVYGTRYPFLLALPLCLLAGAHRTAAQEQAFPHGTVRLIAENTSIQENHRFTLGLHFKLEDGWHMYWLNPGDSGEPPRITWDLPAGFTPGPIQWPVPERLGGSSVVDYGYKAEVTLPVPVQAAANVSSADPVTLKAYVKLLVCKDICVPGKTQVTLSLPVKPQTPNADPAAAKMFSAARARLPRAAPAGWRLTVRDRKDSFLVSAHVGKRIAHAYFYPLEESQIKNASEQLVTPEEGGFRLELTKSDQLTEPITRLRGVLQLAGDRAYLVDAEVISSDKTASRNPAD